MNEQERRRGTRFSMYRECVVCWQDQDIPCRLGDISSVGALILSQERPPLGSQVRLHHISIGSLNGMVVRHAPEGFGLAFEENEEAALYALRAVTLGLSDIEDSRRPQDTTEDD